MHKRMLSPVTVSKHLSGLSGLFRWAERQGYLGDAGVNPIRGLAPDHKQVRKSVKSRRPFTDAELLAVFGSREFIRQREKHPERYWVSLICLFTACRREEAGQLALADVQEVEGIPSLSLANLDDTEEGSRKNEGSRRRVPIHSSLIALGFLDYVQSVRKKRCAHVFPKLPVHLHGKLTAGLGQWFSRLVTKAGITDPAVVMHSLRHGGIHKLHVAGCPQNIAEMLTGHSATSIHDRVYAHRELTPLSQLREGLERLTYPAVVAALTKKAALSPQEAHREEEDAL